ncbi:hypothetical protein [Cyclobacterium jeungdonense]|nr:hypothetical protein [Cyclobacterium jeungdonense]
MQLLILTWIRLRSDNDPDRSATDSALHNRPFNSDQPTYQPGSRLHVF